MSGYYRYYDTPDGKDWHKKTYYLLRRGFGVANVIAFHDVVIITQPKGFIPVFERYMRIFMRPLISLTLFSTTVYTCTRIRGDDAWNHFFGWIPVCIYAQTFLPKPVVWLYIFLPCSIVGYLCKNEKLKYPHMTFMPETSRMRENLDNTVYADYFMYSLRKQLDKGWLTVDDAIKKGIITSKTDAEEKKLSNYKDGMVRGLLRTGDGTESVPRF